MQSFIQSHPLILQEEVQNEKELQMSLKSGDETKVIKVTKDEKELTLLVHFKKTSSSKNSRRKTKDEKIIVSNRGFYIGQTKEGKPNGKGVFYFSQFNINLRELYLKGKWEDGYIAEVALYKNDQKEIEIEMKGESYGKLTFMPKKKGQKPMHYEGELKTDFDDKEYKLSEVMTGHGSIFFPNGDKYTGYVKNGQMHSNEKLSSYYSIETRTRFEGFYKNGQRNGFGRIEIQIPKYEDKQDMQIYIIYVQYQSGSMKWAGNIRGLHAHEMWPGDGRSILEKKGNRGNKSKPSVQNVEERAQI